jgi:transcription antitermination protein NusB
MDDTQPAPSAPSPVLRTPSPPLRAGERDGERGRVDLSSMSETSQYVADFRPPARLPWLKISFVGNVFSGIVMSMGKRREARERAVQFLFQHDLNPPDDLDRALERFWESQRAAAIAGDKGVANWGEPVELPPPSADEAAIRLFADPLIRGALEHRDEADGVIRKHAINWDLHRIAAVDRNILRLAIYEMLHREDIPPVVSINEAVDIAKKFSTQDSGKFVNGILDKVKGELMRPARIVE